MSDADSAAPAAPAAQCAAAGQRQPASAWPRLTLAGLVGLTIIVALGPVAPALDPQAGFFVDWHNSLWMIARHADAIRAGDLPVFYHTTALVGMPHPAFYGPLFYPALGLLAVAVGAPAALALAIGGLALSTTLLLSGLFRALGAGPWRALGYTALVTWTVYPMTCLYNRSALPEYFATGLLLCVLVALLRSLRARSHVNGSTWLHLAGWLFAFTVGTHLITACLGGAALVVAGLLFSRRTLPPWTGGAFTAVLLPALLAATVLAPTAVLLVKFAGRLAIGAGLDGRSFLIAGLDSLSNRLWPIPWVPAGAVVSTPGLDVQINVPLLALVGLGLLLTVRQRGGPGRARRSAYAGLALALGVLLVSSAGAPAFLQTPFHLTQFSYRLVAYTNFFLLAALVALVVSIRRRPPALDALLAATLVWAVVGVALKHHRGFAQLRPERFDRGAAGRLHELPPTFYGALDYAVEPAEALPAGIRPQAQVSFLPSVSLPPTSLPPIEFAVSGAALIRTNILSFPWNRLWLDGQPVPPADLAVIDYRLGVYVSPGAHRIEYRPTPDLLWLWLRRLSLTVVVLWGLGIGARWILASRRLSSTSAFER